MKIGELFSKHPNSLELLNNGVTRVKDASTPEELKTLRFESQTFVCEGQYAKGLDTILRSFLGNLSKPEQPAAWISGFFGSGKSMLAKVHHLWVDFEFPEDGARARGCRNLPREVSDLLKELSTAGKRSGG